MKGAAMSELETAQELAETAVRQVNVFALQGDKVDFLINQLKQIASLPQLTIPKSIADEIDKFAHTNWANWQFYFYSDEMSKELIDWFDNGDSEFTNSKIAMVYLNPLTRDLVKVVEG